MYRRKSRAQVVEVESSKWRKQTDPWLLYLDVAHSVAESKAESNGMKCNLVPLHLSNYIFKTHLSYLYPSNCTCFLKGRLRGRMKFNSPEKNNSEVGKSKLGNYISGN